MRLIDADELVERAARMRLDTREQIAEMIDNAPTIEADIKCEDCMTIIALKAALEPVKRGRWEPHPSEREWDVCSICHTGTKRREYGLNDDGTEWVTEQSYTYCPWCGARMSE